MAQLERRNRNQSIIQFALAVVLLILINVLANSRIGGLPLYGALDLTEDGRYTLTENTFNQLEAIKEPIFIRVLLAGELPLEYQLLQDKVEELMLEFEDIAPSMEWEFADPLSGGTPEEIQQRQRDLQETFGIVPVTVLSQESVAQRSANAVYPYAIIYYGERTRPVSFLTGRLPGVPDSRRINQAENLLEYNFSRALASITNNNKSLIGFTVGNGELPGPKFVDLYRTLAADYEPSPVYLDSFATLPQQIEVLIIAKPTEAFTPFETFKLDQYVMNGGKIIWAIDPVGMDYDSLQGRNQFYPQKRELGLDDLLFKYGIRAGPVLGLDLINTPISLVTGSEGGQPKLTRVPFPYHVKAVPVAEHPIVKNLDPIDLRFPTVLESVNDDPDVEKTVLLQSSDRSRRQRLPSPIDLDANKYSIDLERFNETGLPFAYLLEGQFTSPFANRLSRENEQALRESGLPYKAKSDPTRMIVISDGDILANGVKRDGSYNLLGYNPWDKFTYANKPFMLNAIEYLINPNGVVAARGKDVKLRLLDKEEALASATKWRVINIALPLVLLGLFGLVFNYLRKRRYATPANS